MHPVVLADRPVAYWPMQESTSGEPADDLVKVAGDGTYTASGVTYRGAGPGSGLPKSITTNGSTGSVTFPNINGLPSINGAAQPQSWEVWANTPAITSATALYALWGFTSGTTVFPFVLGSASALISNETVTLGSSTGNRLGWQEPTITAGWHHFVITFTGVANDWCLFIDGREITTTQTMAGTNNGLGTINTATVIGRFSTTFTAVTTAGAGVYQTRLSAGRVSAHYTAGRSGVMVANRGRRLR